MSLKKDAIQTLKEVGKQIRTNIPEILGALDEVVREEFSKLDSKQKKAATCFHFELYAAKQLSKEEAYNALLVWSNIT